MQGRMLVTFETLLDASGQLETAAEDLERRLSAMDKLVKALFEKWEGETRGAFEDNYRQWRAASDELHGSLRGLHTAAKTAHDNYASAKSANLTMWRTH